MFPTDPEKLLTEGDCAGVKITCSDELVANTAKFKDYGVFKLPTALAAPTYQPLK